MEGTMKTAVMLGIGKMGFEERAIPVPKDDEVLVKLEYVGICGSDGSGSREKRKAPESWRPGCTGTGKNLRPL